MDILKIKSSGLMLLALFFAFALLAGCAGNQQAQQPDLTITDENSGKATGTTEIALLSLPTAAEAGKPLEMKWKVSTSEAGQTPHTAVHFGYKSVPSNPAPDLYPSASDYLTGTVPGEFSATITPPIGGTLYYRAHVVVGGKNYWTDEKTIIVSGPGAFADESELDQSLDDSINELDELK